MIAIGLEDISSRFEALASMLAGHRHELEAIPTRLEAIASRLEAIAIRLEANALRVGGHC